ncbi:MAG: DNA methyltransferase [Microthrixaceae bacterium]
MTRAARLEQIKAFRDTWELGIHSYLTYLRDRLLAARDLLTESGSCFVQIGDENVHLVRSLMDEVFGSTNFVSLITSAKTTTTTGGTLPGTTDFIVWYARDIDQVKYRQLFNTKVVGGAGGSLYTSVELADETRRPLTAAEKADVASVPNGARVFGTGDLTSPRVRGTQSGYYPVSAFGREFLPRTGEWKTHRVGMTRLVLANRVARAEGASPTSVTSTTSSYSRSGTSGPTQSARTSSAATRCTSFRRLYESCSAAC